MKIEIVNWDKYNPRSEAKAWSWFRLENDFFDDDDLFDLSASQVLVFLFCCCRRSKAGSSVFKLNPGQAAQKTRTTTDDVLSTLALLVERVKVQIHEPHVRPRTSTHASVRENTDPSPTNVRTYERNETDGTNETNGSRDPSGSQVPEAAPPLPARRARKPAGPPGRGVPVWEAYREAFVGRYGREPVRNSSVNTACAQLVDRLGVDDAVKVARFYLTHNGRWYVQNVHMLRYAVKDAEALHTQMLAGHRVSTAEATTKDKQQGVMQAFMNVAAKFKAEDEAKARAAEEATHGNPQ